MTWKQLHDGLVRLLNLERRIDPFIRPPIDRLLRPPIAGLAQAWLRATRGRAPSMPAMEKTLVGEDECVEKIVEEMSAYMSTHYRPGGYQRAGNTKTHGVVRGRFIIRPDLPDAMRQGVFSAPREFPAWVRFAGPGPGLPPDIDDVGVLSFGIKLMGVDGAKCLDDEQFTQDFTGISTPTFTTPNVVENAKLQTWINRGLPLFYFVNPGDPHLLDAVMQGLWARTQTSPLETEYWSCVPYLLGAGQAMRYSIHPVGTSRTRVPNLPGRPPDNYLREAMAATLNEGPASFEFRIQVQTDPSSMPIEDASIIWSQSLSPPIPAATLVLERQVFDSPAQLAFADRLSFNPWHALAEHRPLGNQNRARKRIYQELSTLRQTMNAVPHVEPTGSETFL